MPVRSLGEGDALEEGMTTHSSFLAWRIPIDRGAWWARVHRVSKSQTQPKQLSMHIDPLFVPIKACAYCVNNVDVPAICRHILKNIRATNSCMG